MCYNWYFESVRKVSAQSVALVIRSEDYNETLSNLNLYPICYQIARAGPYSTMENLAWNNGE